MKKFNTEVHLGFELIVRRPDWGDAFTPFMPNGWGACIKAMGSAIGGKPFVRKILEQIEE